MSGQNDRDMQNKKNTKNASKAVMFSVLITALSMAAAAMAVRMQQKEAPFPLGDYAGISSEALEMQFEQEGDTDTLIELLKSLCYRAEVEHNEKVKDKIVLYGIELLSRAKAETIDLSKIGERDPSLLDLLKMIRKYGAD